MCQAYRLYVNNNSLTSLDVSAAQALTNFVCDDNPALTYLNLGAQPTLWSFSADTTGLSSLTYSSLPELRSLSWNNNSFISLAALFPNGVPPLLESLYLNNNNITSIDVSGLTAIQRLHLEDNALTSLDVSGLTNLRFLYVQYNALTSLRAVGVGQQFGGYAYPSFSWFDYGVDTSQNNLSAAALNQFYTDLVAGYGVINVSGNPGTTTDNPSIATAKGHTIYGS